MKKRKITSRQRIEEFLKAIDWFFGINNWDKKIIYKDKNTNTPHGSEALATVNHDFVYQRITITLYPVFFEESLQEQRKTLIHELLHGITTPLKKACVDQRDGKLVTEMQINRADEEAVSKIENMVDSLLSGKKTYAVQAYKDYLK